MYRYFISKHYELDTNFKRISNTILFSFIHINSAKDTPYNTTHPTDIVSIVAISIGFSKV